MTDGAIPDGMVSWAGGDSAPADWDGGRVLLRDGDAFGQGQDWRHLRWPDGTLCNRDADIIAYTPRAAADRQPEQSEIKVGDPHLNDMVLAPRVATEVMRIVGGRIVAGKTSGRGSAHNEMDARDAYAAMIAAALAPASGEER